MGKPLKARLMDPPPPTHTHTHTYTYYPLARAIKQEVGASALAGPQIFAGHLICAIADPPNDSPARVYGYY